MKPKYRLLLAVDALVNLILGLLLLVFPVGVIALLGLPQTDTYFYATILGGVIFGIGIGLCMEWWGSTKNVSGLGLGGAIAINLCGGGVLLVWLLVGDLALPLRGHIMLWIVALAVLGIGIAEIAARSWRYDD